MEQYKITFSESRSNIEMAYIGGKSLLPADIEWPKNPNGENLVLVMTIPTNFLNNCFDKKLSPNKIISVFTTYNKNDYFLDSIVYNGDNVELDNIKSGFTKVLIHNINNSVRNESEFEIPEKTFEFELVNGNEIYGGTKIGGKPYFLQKNNIQLENYDFILQIYGNDFPEEYNDIFYLTDSIGYLFLNNNEGGLFFIQCT